tara:strand:+ start:4457 stop:5062 length:606 start_codon:yes stop_codon:yes gene_type:complete
MEKNIKDVWFYWPNLLDYFRLVLVISGFLLDSYYELHVLNALLYIFSHFLDLYDGSLARYMNQCSKFGVILDYSVDIISEMLWFIQLVPLVNSLYIKLLIVYVIIIDIFGLVFSVYNSAGGRYWKEIKERSIFQKPFINDKGYTRLGYSVVFWYQVFWGVLYLSYFYEVSNIIIIGLSIPFLLELLSLTMILHEQLLLFRE